MGNEPSGKQRDCLVLYFIKFKLLLGEWLTVQIGQSFVVAAGLVFCHEIVG